MAIVKLGDLVSGIRGSVGGVTYSANTNGPYTRAWSRGPNGRSGKQSARRGILSSLGGQWRGLTAAERNNWAYYIFAPCELPYNSLGEVITLSRWQWFCKLVARRYLLSATPSLLAGTGAPIPLVQSYSFSVSLTGGAVLNYSTWFSTYPHEAAVLFCGRGGGSVNPVGPQGMRLIWAAVGPGGTSTDVMPQLSAVFPNLQVGERVGWAACNQAPLGQRGPWTWGVVEVTA